ncbi:uncharacterized protein LOC141785472 [Halichoeres trimaculatus]|uniref:uncharacterized protein LOC141785472 n=1 Tax=Halichoeres trimaculatus TaxID=147232 RepID=UPI003D9E74FC
MPETAESHLSTIPTNRACVIEIKNDSQKYCLVNPQVHMESGFSFSPPAPTLNLGKDEVLSFTKDDNTASGAVGVFTYELFCTQTRCSTEVIAVMFSVPFDYGFYSNWLAIGVFPKETECNEDLFKLMYNNDGPFVRYKADGSGICYKGRNLDIRACMCDEGRAIVKIELYDSMGL